jgi:predicted GIY-YIG superfamily endonuclease
MSNRDTRKYVLRDSSGKDLYYGITNDLDRRKEEHLGSGKKFAEMVQIGRATTRDAASEWEKVAIQDYKDSHRGRRPRYNQTDWG